MTNAKVQQLSILTTFIFAALNASFFIGIVVLFPSIKNEAFYLENQMNGRFLDLFFPLLIMFSVFYGRRLGNSILFSGGIELVSRASGVILLVVLGSLSSTILLRFTYFFAVKCYDENYFQTFDGSFTFFGQLVIAYIIMIISVFFFYIVNLIPSRICGALHAGVLEIIFKDYFQQGPQDDF